jgi:hypothetical protein
VPGSARVSCAPVATVDVVLGVGPGGFAGILWAASDGTAERPLGDGADQEAGDDEHDHDHDAAVRPFAQAVTN